MLIDLREKIDWVLGEQLSWSQNLSRSKSGDYNVKWLDGQVKETLLEGERHWPMPHLFRKQVCIPWYPQKYNAFFSICFIWPKPFPSHGPVSDETTGEKAEQHIWESAPLTQSIALFGGRTDFRGILQLRGDWMPWRRVRRAKDDELKWS